MNIGHVIRKLRTEAKLTQTQFAEIVGVSQQAVQRWEADLASPDLDNTIMISKFFHVSLDALILGNDSRFVEEMKPIRTIKPQFQKIPHWEFYSSDLLTEYRQSLDEGLDVEQYHDIFLAVAGLPKGEVKKKFGDILFDIVISAKNREGYSYFEPSDLEQIQKLRTGTTLPLTYDKTTLQDKIHGAWVGRVCGCMLGKSIEGIHTDELIPFLRETDNYPMHRYIYRSDLTNDIIGKYRFGFAGRCYADEIDGMPVDDDINYVVLAQKIIQKYGRSFTPYDVSEAWLKYQGKNAYCTAERVAYCNFVNGFLPPDSAVYKNPYREYIGAQIRGDYFGYINPGQPELAADMAWRDASISHVKNGIYGEMFVSAMLAAAAATADMEDIVMAGLSQIPYTSRLYEGAMSVVHAFHANVTQQDCFQMIHEKFDEYTGYGWCHTIPNAMIVIASLLYGGGDFSRSVCMAVETGFDTDCNGATVGSVLGMAKGIQSIPEYWVKPIRNTLHTSVFGMETVAVSDCVAVTMEHVAL